MQSNSERTSFFDDDDLKIKFEFRKPDKKDHYDFQQPPTIKGRLFCKSKDSAKATEGFYVLQHRLLVSYKDESSKTADTVLYLPHARLVPIETASSTNSKGFNVIKNGQTFEFSSRDTSSIEYWIQALRNLCVLQTFHDEYKALKMIGKGSFAKVYLVESKQSGENYAVKAFTKESLFLSNKSNAKPAMLNEIDIMRECNHENVIKLYEVYETEKSIYLVLELIQGKSLQDILKKSTFRDTYPEAKRVQMMRQLVDALAYLAVKGVMHRDLKPDNILLDKGETIKIVDFGLATFINIPEYIFKKCGTPGYIAPEVFKFDAKQPETSYDDKSDVFGAGAILYYMLFGSAFFEGTNASEILKANRKYTVEYPSMKLLQSEHKNKDTKYNKEGLDLCLKMLEFDKKKRIKASDALLHPFLIRKEEEAYLESINNDGSLSPLKKKSLREDFVKKLSGSINGSSNNVTGDRYDQKGSLYLDLGKPELNGKVDTLTAGSQNNSLLLNQKGGDSREGSLSNFTGKDSASRRAGRSDSFKGSSSFYKRSLLNSADKSSNEEDKESMSPTIKSRFSRMNSDVQRNSYGSDDSGENQTSEGVGKKNLPKIQTYGKTVGRTSNPSPLRKRY